MAKQKAGPAKEDRSLIVDDEVGISRSSNRFLATPASRSSARSMARTR